MNRLTHASETTDTFSSASVEQGRYSRSVSRHLAYSLFAPLHYEKNYAYPLVVWLHGPGDDERQLQRIMPLISMRNYVGVCPRATIPGNERHQLPTWEQSSVGIETAEQVVMDVIDVASERFNVAEHRIFLAGFQTGGTMAMRIAVQNPHRFAGALTIGGPFPSGATPLGKIDNLRDFPFFIAQGRDSTRYPIQRLCEEVKLFHAAGMSVTIRQYPRADELDSLMLHDMDVWMMEHVTGFSQESQADNQDEGYWSAN